MCVGSLSSFAWLPQRALWTKLEELDISYNSVIAEHMEWLFHAPMPALTRLELRENPGLGDAGVAALIARDALPNLETIDLRDSGVSEEGVALLRRAPGLPKLETILV